MSRGDRGMVQDHRRRAGDRLLGAALVLSVSAGTAGRLLTPLGSQMPAPRSAGATARAASRSLLRRPRLQGHSAHARRAAQPARSAGHIYFVRANRVYGMSGRGRGLHLVTTTGSARAPDGHAALSPDGHYLLYVHAHEATHTVVQGTSPDGTAYSDTEAVNGVYLVPLTSATAAHARLLYRADNADYPSWAPDAQQVAVSSGDWLQAYPRISLLPLATADPAGRAVPIADTGAPQLASAWSPDGGSLLFTDVTDSLSAVGTTQDTLVVENLRSRAMRPLIASATFDYDRPRYAPDGHLVACIRTRQDDQGQPTLWVMRADGTQGHALATGLDADSAAAWSPDGRRLLFARGGNLYTVDLASGRTTLVIMHGSDPVWGR